MQRLARYAWLVLAGVPALLSAQGFGIYEQNTCVMGRAGAAVASPCDDGSAVFFNPAAIAGVKGGRASAGVTLIDVHGGFTDDLFQQKYDLNDPLLVIPQVFATYSVTPKIGVGLGFFAPYGLETKWPLSFDGKFAGYDNIIKTYYVQPTVAYQLTPQLSIGAGLDIVHGSVELRQKLDLSQTPVPVAGLPPGTTFGQFGIPLGTDFADADLNASKTSFGGHFGALFKVNNKLSFGARYLMKVNLDYAGTAHFTQDSTHLVIPATITIPGLPPIAAGTPVDALLNSLGVFSSSSLLGDQTVTTSLANPDMFVAGVAFKPDSALALYADYQWTHWTTFQTLVLAFSPNTLLNQTLYESYQDTHGIRLGIEWKASSNVTARGGYVRHGGAAPAQTVTPLLPEGARNEFTVGWTFRVSSQVHMDLAYQHIRQDDRRGRTRETPNVMPTTALNNGLYDFSANLFGISLGMSF
jgi:long-chain fatty acid transport protein